MRRRSTTSIHRFQQQHLTSNPYRIGLESVESLAPDSAAAKPDADGPLLTQINKQS
jgi:hypothetical protein